MISNQILQNTIDTLKEISNLEFSVLDEDGKEVVSTGAMPDEVTKIAADFLLSPAQAQEMRGFHFFKIYDDQLPEYVLITSAGSENNYLIGKLAAAQIQSLVVAYKEHYDRDNFMKNLLLDNLLLVDIFNRAKKLHIKSDENRVVMMIICDNERSFNVQETVKSCAGSRSGDFVTEVDADNMILVKEVGEMDMPEIVADAEQLVKKLEAEGMKNVRLAIGTIVRDLKDVSRSYKEARMSLDVGRIFFEDKQVISYAELGIGRLIYQLPIPLCLMFIKEIFGGKKPDEFDQETLVTIEKFFENNLNVSETSRQLFIHRNTLVYRLDKLQKSTGLDLRVFEDAITFKIAMMVVKYMQNVEKTDY